MNGLKQLLGEKRLNTALEHLLAKYGNPGLKPTTLDFLEELYAVAPEQRELINDWLKKVFIYDLKVLSAHYERLNNGRFSVNAKIITRRSCVGENKSETPAPLDEPIEVGVFTADPEEATGDQVLYLRQHQFTADTTTITFVVDKRPTVIAIDPYITRVDKNLTDNVYEMGD